MSEMIPHAFEDSLIRSFLREDGEPCFIAKDVCACLETKKTDSALRGLDEDEKGTRLMSTLGGNQEMSYVTEGGLYTLILRSRKAVTPGTVQHRFRKWVTSELLPTIRQTGRYEMPGREGGIDLGSLQELSNKARLVDLALKLKGREAAYVLWEQLGLPELSEGGPDRAPDGPDLHPVDEFIAACVMPARGNLLSAADFRAAYAEWAKGHDRPHLNMTVIGRRVREAGIRKTRPGGDSRHYYYADIALVVGGEQ
ncbi:BRO family, N-terminal domain [Cohaesibacter sp. ES.047]|uniref:BRO-N domain-containing protein n=1 Tax=Cohaesibacter sp. ES.047 TaxID=1798205 RepID=UPI000BB8380F|nr:Bro-N domain-containing protein [Cohaesibacter sp. ES.047]SNY94080.1 BRO family, N-terminal domain [Cohaesibacter sp. ES.047]